MSTLDPELMATLTDEERAAMTDDTDDAAALAAIAGDANPATVTGTGNDDPNATDEDEDDEDDGPVDPNVPPVEGKPAADTPADKPADTTTQTPADEPGEPEQAAPQYRAELPADFDARVAAITTRTAEIQQKFNDGEIDLAERDAELGAVNADRDELNRVRARVESLQEINAQNAQAFWQRQIASFMATAAKEQGGIDYRTDPKMAAELDKQVKALALDDDNAERDGPWFLATAHKMVKAKFDIVTTNGAPPAKVKTDAEKIAEARAARKPAIDATPKNLAAVPGSDGPGDVEGEFADVDALTGQALDDAIARMTPAQHARWLRSA